MRIQWSRPSTQGSMAGLLKETKVEDIPDTDPSTNEPNTVPAGAEVVGADVPVHDWAVVTGFTR